MTIFRLSVFTICAKLKRLIFSAILALVLFSSIILPPLQVQAQTTGDTNIFGSVGFRECTFTDTIRTGSDVDSVRTGGTLTVAENQFQQCIQTIFRFFFVIAIFLIAIRIAVEAFAGINPMVGGKEVDNSIGLIRDVTIGLILIGSPSLFLSFLNPATLSIQQLINLNGIGLRDSSSSNTRSGAGALISTTPRATTIRIGDKDLSAEDINKTIQNTDSQESKQLFGQLPSIFASQSLPPEIASALVSALDKIPPAQVKQILDEVNGTVRTGNNTITNRTLLDRFQVGGSTSRGKDAAGNEFIPIRCTNSLGQELNLRISSIDGPCNKTIIVPKEEAENCRPYLDKTVVQGKIGCKVWLIEN